MLRLTHPGKFFTNACLSVALLTGVLPVANGQTLEAHPVFEVGDKWTYSYQNKGDRKEPYTYTNQVYALDAESAWLYGESQEPNARRAQYHLQYDFKRARVVEGFNFVAQKPKVAGSQYSNSRPADDQIQLPLQVGKKYNVNWDWNTDSGNAGYDEYKAEVEAMERVKVPAGEFETYRIKLSGWWTCKSGCNGNGRVERQYWWSPDAKRVVKETYQNWGNRGLWNNTETVLVKWEPKAALSEALTNPPPAAAPPAPAASAAAVSK